MASQDQDLIPDLAFDYQTIAEQVKQARKAKKKHVPDVATLTTAITEVSMEDTIEGSSTLEVTVIDPDFELLSFFEISKSGKIFPLDLNYPLDSANWWRLTQMDVNGGIDGTRFTLTFMERPVVWLTHHYGPIKMSRGKMTRAEFFQSLVKKIKVGRGLEFKSYQLHVKQPVEGGGTGGSGGGSTSGGSKSGKVGSAHTLLHIGDLLAESTVPYEEDTLGAKVVDANTMGGRTSANGVIVLKQELRTTHNVVIFDLGTNDDILNPSATVANLKAAKQAIKNRRLIVTTINYNRPPVTISSVAIFNDAIKKFAAQTPGVTLVDWYTISRPEDLDTDGMHCTPAGYKKRANSFTSAVGRTHGGPSSSRDSRDPSAHQGGIPLSADCKIARGKAHPDQIRRVNLCLKVAAELNASKKAVLTMLVAGIGESGFTEVVNRLGYGGVFQGQVETGGRYFKVNDTEAMCRSFFLGGKGFGGNGGVHGTGAAIEQVKKYPDKSPGMIAADTEISWPAPGMETKQIAERHYQQYIDEAEKLYELSGGGFSAGGDTGGGATSYYRQQYNFQIGDDANPRTNYWDGMTSLAKEVNWRLFCRGRTIFFDSDMTLVRRRPAWVVSREDPAVTDWSARWDDRRIATEMQLTAICDPFDYRAGDVFLLEDFGPLSDGSSAEPDPLPGRWLITDITRRSGDLTSTFTLIQPSKPNLEPATEMAPRTSEPTDQQNDASGGNGLGDLDSQITPKEVIDKLVLPIGRKHNAHAAIGGTLNPENVTTSNHNHDKYSASGNVSDHHGPPNVAWAADMAFGPVIDSPNGDALADELADVFKMTGGKRKNHIYAFGVVDAVHKGFKFQLGWRVEGHHDHVHFGAHRVGSPPAR